jgi:hypothetical protein
LWANFRALIGIFIQTVGPNLAIWPIPVQFSLCESAAMRHSPTRGTLCVLRDSMGAIVYTSWEWEHMTCQPWSRGRRAAVARHAPSLSHTTNVIKQRDRVARGAPARRPGTRLSRRSAPRSRWVRWLAHRRVNGRDRIVARPSSNVGARLKGLARVPVAAAGGAGRHRGGRRTRSPASCYTLHLSLGSISGSLTAVAEPKMGCRMCHLNLMVVEVCR